jgi:hypothetical protein
MKNRKSAGPEESVRRDAKEVTAIEQYWHAAGRPKSRKPAKNYKYIDELAHLQFEPINAPSFWRPRRPCSGPSSGSSSSWISRSRARTASPPTRSSK